MPYRDDHEATLARLAAAEQLIQQLRVQIDLHQAEIASLRERLGDKKTVSLPPATQSGDDILRRYREGERNFVGINLIGVLLGGAKLASAIFNGSNLSWADLSEATLTEASLVGANLRSANLRKAVLAGADLRGADLTGAELKGARLRVAWYDRSTRFPDGFDPRQAGMRR
jgi:uncharacterized protein YjbI with pentapeptide repeats